MTRAQPKSVAEYPVPVLDRNTQNEIVARLNKCKIIIDSKEQELEQLDTLVKSRFAEMFGDISDDEKKTMADICTIITDGTHQPPKFVSEGIPFLFVSNIVTNEISYDTQKFISEETYAKLIKRTPIESEIFFCQQSVHTVIRQL